MAGPFIFIVTNRLKPGKLDAEKKRVPGLVEFVQANEPLVLAFNEYVDEGRARPTTSAASPVGRVDPRHSVDPRSTVTSPA